MAATPKQIAANRKNAQKSTGPKTPEGKAISRRNGLKHGLTGRGIVVPTHMEQPIAECTRRFVAVHPPVNDIAATMLGQAAVMAVRMKECATLHDAAYHDRREAALVDWDHRHMVGLDGVLAEMIGAGSRLDPPPIVRDDDPASAIVTLDQWLIGLTDLRTRLDTAIDAWNKAHPNGYDPDESDESRRSFWAGLTPGIDANNAPGWHDSINREITSLQAARQGIATGERAAARERAAVRGAADRSLEAERERRYELAAQRGFVQIFTAFQRYQASQGVPVGPPEPPTAPPPPPEPAAIAPPAPDNPAQINTVQPLEATPLAAASSSPEPSAGPKPSTGAARPSRKERRKQAKLARRQHRQR